jgi:hypothetical protein
MTNHGERNDELTPAMREFGEQLRTAAHRELGAPVRRHRRVSRRGLALALAVIVASVGAATAAELISTGKPARDTRDLPARIKPNVSLPTLALTARDPARRLPWGVATYATRDGHDCVLLGQANMGRLGEAVGATFRPYLADRPGVCGRLDAVPLFFAVAYSRDEPRRTLVFGRARGGVSTVTIGEPDTTHRVRTGPDGAFLAVLDGRVDNKAVSVAAADG